MWAERRLPSAPVWLVILALHAVVLSALNTRPRAAATPRDWSELRLLPLRPAAAPTPPLAAPKPAPRTDNVDTSPAPAQTGPLDTTAPAPEPPPPETPAAPDPGPPLRLTLPTQPWRQPALDDPRGNTPVGRFGQHIANDLGGDGRWAEERMDADTVRLRRGNTCINLHRNRTAGRQPFDEASAPTPWGATPAYRCERR